MCPTGEFFDTGPNCTECPDKIERVDRKNVLCLLSGTELVQPEPTVDSCDSHDPSIDYMWFVINTALIISFTIAHFAWKRFSS